MHRPQEAGARLPLDKSEGHPGKKSASRDVTDAVTFRWKIYKS